MKTTLFSVLILVAASVAATASAHACGTNRNVNGPYNSSPADPYAMPYPPTNLNSPAVSPFGAANPAAVNFAPSSPQSRLTVVPSTLSTAVSSAPTVTTANTENVGTLHVVPDTDTTTVPKTSPTVDPALTKPIEATVSTKAAPKVDATAAAPKEDDSKIADELKGLVGTWMAVARHGDGELTTVELQLDSKGWAKLTVPGTSGTPSTITRRVELNEENKELKLTSPEGALALGKLVEFNSRQFVLDRDGGQVTFVRP